MGWTTIYVNFLKARRPFVSMIKSLLPYVLISSPNLPYMQNSISQPTRNNIIKKKKKAIKAFKLCILKGKQTNKKTYT